MKKTTLAAIAIAVACFSVLLIFKDNAPHKSQNNKPVATQSPVHSGAQPLASVALEEKEIPVPLPDSSARTDKPVGQTDVSAVSKPVGASREDLLPTVRLWQHSSGDSTTDIDGIPAVKLQVNPQHLQQFHVGQTLVLPIPQENMEFTAEVASTHNDLTGVKVWQANILDEEPGASVIITQGKKETHMVIASNSGTYTAVINNASGQATLIDEGELHARQLPFEDGIVINPTEDEPLHLGH